MMNFSNDLNFLAANNIIGYDTYSNSLNGMGYGSGRYNPFGRGVVNTGLSTDVYSPSNTASKIGAVSISACVFAFLGRFFADAISSGGKKTKHTPILKTIKKALGIKTTRRTARKCASKAVKTGFKGFLTKAGKCCKATAIVAGVGALAAGGAKLYQAYKMRNMPLNVYGQPQDTVTLSKNDSDNSEYQVN